ncbi:small, acid-soluble spore protein, alpha/beta type [Pontibacillus salicampi]|uniref:Small, acid-soluble spore protein, alpha/beta type n=1 Tax=Pontibacillus salicampi TaxID=1449801 RepID=A0ABV6LPV2_9BACI
MANNKLLVPEARAGMDSLKASIIERKEISQGNRKTAHENAVPSQTDKGNLTSREAGQQGGSLGGNMVRELVRMGEQQLKNNKP